MATPNRAVQVLRTTVDFLRLGRPLFLAGGFSLHGLGVAAALWNGASLNLPALLWGQVAITATQLMTHYSNDYFDLAADRANQTPTRWSGGSRVLPEGRLDPRIALWTAVLFGLIGLGASLVLALVVRSGPPTLPLLLLSLALAWSYSSPPLQLNQRGAGELTGAVLITGLTPIVGYALQAGRLEALPFLAVFPLCCLQFDMLLTINYPDAAGDKATGKHTLLHFLGPVTSARLYLVVLVVTYAAIPLLVFLGLPPLAGLAVGAISPLALWQGWRMARGAWADPARWNSLAFWSIGLLMSTVAAELGAFVLLLLL